MNKEIITLINKKYIELGKYEEASHIVSSLWLPRCVIELLEEKIEASKKEIKNLEKMLEND